jgi:hypothetical protein
MRDGSDLSGGGVLYVDAGKARHEEGMGRETCGPTFLTGEVTHERNISQSVGLGKDRPVEHSAARRRISRANNSGDMALGVCTIDCGPQPEIRLVGEVNATIGRLAAIVDQA